MGHQLTNTVRASELAKGLKLALVGQDVALERVTTLNAAADGSLCFSKGALESALAVRALVVAPPGSPPGSGAVIESETPRLTFARALQWLDEHAGFRASETPGHIDSTAKVSPSAVLGEGVRIGARSVVRHHAVIGDGVCIGEDCLIKSSAVVGEEGFGFERDEAGNPVRIPHLGSVVLGNRVEVGNFTTVCRGTLANTIVEDDAKIDDHVHIAHNVIVRRGAMIIACAEVSGGVEVGEYSWIGPNASVIQKVKLGERSLVGIGANVTKSVDKDTTVVGNPARPLRSAGPP